MLSIEIGFSSTKISPLETVSKSFASLKSVDFGLGVYSIGESAYERCGLITISLPASVNSVGNFAFRDCSSTTSLSLMAGVGSLQTTSFMGLTNCTSVYIDSDFTADIGHDASDKGVFDRMGAAAQKPVDFVFGNNVKKIKVTEFFAQLP